VVDSATRAVAQVRTSARRLGIRRSLRL